MPILAEARLRGEGIPVERSDKTGTAKMSESPRFDSLLRMQNESGGTSFFAAEPRKTFGVKKSALSERNPQPRVDSQFPPPRRPPIFCIFENNPLRIEFPANPVTFSVILILTRLVAQRNQLLYP